MAKHKTGFFWDEKCFWHGGGNYAMMAPVGGLVQPMVAGGLPEAPETKRRLKNLMDVSGLSAELVLSSAEPASEPHSDKAGMKSLRSRRAWSNKPSRP